MKIVTVSFLLINFWSVSQEEIMDIYIIDTLEYNNSEVIVFSDSTWEYLRDYQEYYTKTTTAGEGIPLFDTAAVCSYNWSTNKTHGIPVLNLKDMSDSIEINCANYHPPVPGHVSSGYKIRWGTWHKGNDYEAKKGDVVSCAFDGVVRYASYNSGGYGNLVIVRHYNGLETYYAHLSEINVKPNQKVNSGDRLGLIGSTGHSTGPHLHFETRILENSFDPSIIKPNGTITLSKNDFKSQTSKGGHFKLKSIIRSAPKEVYQVTKKRTRKTGGNM